MIKFKLSDAMHDEYMCREIDHPVYDRMIVCGPGVYELTVDEAKEIRSDAEFYCDPYGPAEYLTVGMRSAYRAVRNQMTKQLAAHAAQEAADVAAIEDFLGPDGWEPAFPPLPVPSFRERVAEAAAEVNRIAAMKESMA